MIPKIIHYCWFGYGEKSLLIKKCISSWKKYCPDYEIIEWNEENFDINSNEYVKEAYNNKKYAFVSDYVRLYAIYSQGGIYMDTDVEVVRTLDEFLMHQGFSGFESDTYIQTGIMAGEKGFPLFKNIMEYYNDRHFIDKDGNIDTTTNVVFITTKLLELGLIQNGKFQIVRGLALYPKDVFCPLDDATGIISKSKNTATIHWFDKSWISKGQRIRSKITRIFHRIFGINCFNFLKKDKI